MTAGKIRLLEENVANKIAAGEVVHRPESVVKELMENSIDAGATQLDVIVKGAGKTLIQVTDNGEGMSGEDLSKCTLRHATSKIRDYEDLDSLKTFGFRGEALSAISAVSRIEIISKRIEDEIGSHLISDEGKTEIRKRASSDGTTVIVKNLFYNTPARRNFLKTNSTELRHVTDIFKRISLSKPHISFRLYIDDEISYDFPQGTIEQRMRSMFADNIMEALLPMEMNTDFASLTGFISKPNFMSRSRGEQYLFVNGRYVVSRNLNHSVFRAYEHLTEKGEFPFFIIFLTLDPSKTDVNVHPSKLEIKFENEQGIYSILHSVVRKILGSSDLLPEIRLYPDENKDSLSSPGIFRENELDNLFRNIRPDFRSGLSREGDFTEQVLQTYPSDRKAESGQALFIVQLHNKYILSQIRSGLVIIDQHVAHERILYEKALKLFKANLPFSQQLLFSQPLEMDPGDYLLLKELGDNLVKLGFAIKFFSRNTVVIDGVPPDIKVGQEKEVLLELLGEFKNNLKEKAPDHTDNLAKSFACKAAVKAGDRLTESEMRELVDQLFATSMPFVCPHGRPVMVKITLEELDKKFGRA